MPSPQKKYTTLVSNTLLFAISNFSSKLLSFFIRPYLSYALDSPDVMGVSSLLQQATNLLIPVVSLGVADAVNRFGLDKSINKDSVFVNGAATIGLGFVVLLLAMPLVRLIPNAAEYLGFLYLCVLASCLHDYHIDWQPEAAYLCTCQMGKRAYPYLPNHKLNTLCDHLQLSLDHHKAGSDSRACALLLLNYLEKGLQPEAFLRTYRFADRKTIPYCGCR